MICSATWVEWRSSNARRRRRHEHDLVGPLEELVEPQRAVVERRRQPEPELDERLLARPVALVHPADLRDGLMRLVDDDQEVVGEVVEQRVRRRPRLAAVEVARVVLDAVAEAHLAQHLHVVLGARAQAVRLEHLALGLELGQARAQLGVDRLDRRLERASLHRVVRRRVDREVVEPGVDLARQRVEVGDRLDLVAEEADPVGRLGVGRLHLDHVAADAEPAAAHDRRRFAGNGCRPASTGSSRAASRRRPTRSRPCRSTSRASRCRRCTRPRRR